MSFQAPLFLAGLAVVPLALAALALARRRPARYVVRFPATATLAAVVPRSARWRRLVPPTLLSLALAGLVLALARPEATVAVPVERASVVLVTDTSGSMEATDVAPSRLAAAKAAAERFLDRVPDELQVGLVGYADGAHTVLQPTQDRAGVRAALDGLLATGGTATGEALASALRALGDRKAGSPPAAVVLLSDGATTVGRDPLAVAQEARTARVPVYTVALGTAEGTVQTPDGQVLRVPPDTEALRRIAELSGGRAFAAEDADALDAVYENLGSQIGTREERREISAGFAAAGLLLLAGAVATSLRWRGRLP
ncbi:MAG TPA: VWA domain-containing protein [Solirubrobacteraceae bacterium]|nr:VWA domain-containing protein [Solirubrobacteraceae bacterium]